MINKYNIKYRILKVFSLPLLVDLYYPITKFLRSQFDNFTEANFKVNDVILFHKKNILKYKGKVALEIGAGQSLFQNTYLSRYLDYQYLIDLDRIVDLKYINLGLKKNNLKRVKKIIELQKYNISYDAPCDILNKNKTDFNKKIDFFLSTSTFEHIPKESLLSILFHLKKILNKDSYLSLHIDYSDHLSHNDKKYGRNNFLKFSEKEFSKFNSRLLYQNRLRHEHYRKLFITAGYTILEDEASNYDDPPKNLNKKILTGNDSDFFTTGRWVLKS